MGLLSLHFYEAGNEMVARNAENLYHLYQLFNF